MGKHRGRFRDRHWVVIESRRHDILPSWRARCLDCGYKTGPTQKPIARLFAKLHMAMSSFIVVAYRAGMKAGAQADG